MPPSSPEASHSQVHFATCSSAHAHTDTVIVLLCAQTFTGTPGEAVLYFGCRRREEDYIYGEELEVFAAEGTLSQLRVAFSRAQEAKQYVQHLMAQDATKLARIIKSGGSVYVCGDGATMVKDVHAALATALQTSGMLKAEAEAALTAMAKAGRYVKDVWS